MKRRRVLLLVAMVALLAGVFLAWPRGPKEPVHEGKTLTQWIHGAHDIGIFEQRDQLNAAMNAMGTNAVPWLLHEFTLPISPWRERLAARLNALPLVKRRLRTNAGRIRTAANGLMLLRTNAAPAVPILLRYLKDPDPMRGRSASFILGLIGDAALPPLTATFATTNAIAITNALVTLQLLCSRLPGARDMLLDTPGHSSPIVRAAAIRPWREIAGDSVNLVPGLVKMAGDPSPLVRAAATNQLAWFAAQTNHSFRADAVAALLQLKTNSLPYRE